MATQTPEELKSGTYDPHVPTLLDYMMYAQYSTVRLRLLAWFGDPVAKRILEQR